MNSTQQQLRNEFIRAVSGEFADAIAKIQHCVGQLSGEQLWWRPDESMNSIANLILHLCGNVRQWIVSGVGGLPDTRNRPQEFEQRRQLSASDLVERLESLEKDTRQALDSVTTDELLRRRVIQGFDVTALQAIVESVAHFRGHTQEIVHLTRIQLGDDYQFDFIPGPGQHGGGT